MNIKCHKILIIFFFISVTITSAQESCDCNLLKKLDKSILLDSIQLKKTISIFSASSIECQFEAYNFEFEKYKRDNQFDKAELTLKKQEKLIQQLKCSTHFKNVLLDNKLSFYKETNSLENLLNVAFEILQKAKKDKNSEREIIALQHIVFVFTRLNEDDKNWNYIKQAQKLIEDLEKTKKSTKYYRWLALEYENKYTITKRKTLIDSALIFINSAKKIALKHKLNDELIEVYKVLEACSYHKKDPEKAVVYIDSAIYYAKLSKAYKTLAPIYIYKSWDLLDLKKYKEVEKSLDSAKKYNTLKGGARIAFYHEVSEIYQTMGKFDKALLNYKKQSVLKDSIININTLEKVNDIEQKYNKVANENKIVQLEKTKQFYLFLIISVLLVLVTIVLIFRGRSLKNKQIILMTEQRLNKARINPHFFFNSMVSLQNLSLKEDSPKTTLFISRFAKIMRKSLENTYYDFISIENEIDFLKQYLEVQRLRFPNKFEFQFFIDDAIDTFELKIPSMIIQPFVENAIEHGFKNINYKGELHIKFIDENDNIKIIVKDNGNGFEVDNSDQNYTSRAMQIIRDRLYLLNKQHKTKAGYKIIKQDDSKGFEILITLPKLYDDEDINS